MITLNYSLWSVLSFFDYILTDIEQKDRLYSRQNLPKLEQLLRNYIDSIDWSYERKYFWNKIFHKFSWVKKLCNKFVHYSFFCLLFLQDFLLIKA